MGQPPFNPDSSQQWRPPPVPQPPPQWGYPHYPQQPMPPQQPYGQQSSPPQQPYGQQPYPQQAPLQPPQMPPGPPRKSKKPWYRRPLGLISLLVGALLVCGLCGILTNSTHRSPST